jgi:hypothetical protein
VRLRWVKHEVAESASNGSENPGATIDDDFGLALEAVCLSLDFIVKRYSAAGRAEFDRLVAEGSRSTDSVRRERVAAQLLALVERETGRRIMRARSGDALRGLRLIGDGGMAGRSAAPVYGCPRQGSARCAALSVLEPGETQPPRCGFEVADYVHVEER